MSRRVSEPWRPDVSVIVPVYNRAGVIGACLESLLESDYPPERREIIVVDNGSTDGTPAALARYGDRIHRLHEPRRGAAAARNAGLRAAGGEVAAFTDSDCVVAPDWLGQIVAPLKDSLVGAAGGRILALPTGNRVEHFGERIHDHRKAIEHFRPPYVITMNLASRLEVLRSLGLFDQRLLRCEDVDLAYRLVQAGYRMVYVHEAVVRHRNRKTLGALFVEGYMHGYHAVRLRALHARFSEAVAARERSRDRPRPAPPSAYSRELPPRREALYSFIFRCGKRCGRTLGSFQRSDLEPEAKQ